jgi:protein-disulfide isomerase
MEPNNNRSQLIGIPGAIIIAATIIAIALIYIFHPASKASTPSAAAQVQQGSAAAMAPVTTADHIFGNPNAPIKIVEYSDPSCPYCKMFNPTMIQIMTAYGSSGKVAWVYRSFPLDKPDQNGAILHPNAGHEAEGLECAGLLGGNDKFWAYENAWYSTFPLQGATDRSVASDTDQLVSIAKAVGLDGSSFNDCLASDQFKSKIDAQYTDGINTGVSGTPYNVIITPAGSQIPVAGAVSFATLKTTIDTLLTEAK